MHYLEKRSHDAEMVVDVVEPQATDDEVQQYAEETNRLVLTSDQDFLARGYPTLFQENHSILNYLCRPYSGIYTGTDR
ncbi:hypothetical protein BRC75_01835 [Halobacteriales archaeon QH_7_69_31]|nr:MAG: hypothetical protein BRC75_01835 [Halobacteriales archaeon QH_7_69_31]